MRDIETVNQIIDYIEGHLTEKLDLSTVSEAVHYSKYHLHRVFKNAVGLTIHDYAQRRQITEAAKLVAFSQRAIADISLLAGYESQQAFSAAFKALYKKSPGKFREDEIFYPLQLRLEFKGAFNMLGDKSIKGQAIRFAKPEDIPAWIGLVRLVIDGYPYLNEAEHVEALKAGIAKRQVLILTDADTAVGGMMFSYDTGDIGFFGVHPLYRKKGIAKLFFERLLVELNGKEKISITTYRAGDKADTGHRAEFKKMGFADAELLVEFGYPTQKLVLSNPDTERIKDFENGKRKGKNGSISG